ncbi:DsrE family protein [Sediminibacterium goheungense]|uniref:Intracellular sulfur oxidation DsrE/DsrF family protein n=1 Tax=Sediminibacterium goheungense TaxID=1086393 RepID=A0A4R6IU83_9BACT|nr:DsrE family protein [Sediminibacterium goheungense]TDO25861.1 intracellular sulfur oxidation DsrE/DsrF family protein [Sediminibacterium goheungense]
MKKIVLFILTVVAVSFSQAQDNKVNPIIKDFGPVYEIPDAVEKPDPKLNYKLLVDLVMASSKPDTINLGIEAACTLLNLHGVGGVPKEKINMVMAVHNAAGYTVLNNEAYRARYKTDNPNLPMIQALLDAGVKIVVCGQTLKKRGIDPSTLAPGIGVATSALTTITTYQLKGYATIKW